MTLLMASKEDQVPLLEAQAIAAASKYDRTKQRRYIFTIVGLALLAIGSLSVNARYHRLSLGSLSLASAEIETCPSLDAIPVKAPKKNVWKNIDISEAVAIRNWLRRDEFGFNLTRGRKATDNDNLIQLIEAVQPKKDQALAYLSGNGPEPEKYAHAIINHGGVDHPIIRDYLIGPLPLSERTTVQQRKDIYHSPDIPFNARSLYGTGNMQALGKFVQKLLSPISNITLDLFGAEAHGDFKRDTIVAGGNAYVKLFTIGSYVSYAPSFRPVSYDGSFRRMWMPFKLNVPGMWLHPIDFYVYCELSGTDFEQWKVLKVVYNHQVFNSMAAFVDAYEKGTLKRSPKPEHKSEWASRTPKGKGQPRDLDDRAGPRSVMFDGPRFRADVEQRYISWLGWSFYMGFEFDMGLNFFDINFRGERIIYELTPQEAMAQYSGNDPHQASTVWLDRAFGMGNLVREMFVGYDCPSDALYLPATLHGEAGSTTRLNAICVFERDSGKPLSRHTGWQKDEMGATKGYELVVRSISTVGNYDYLFDYTFQLDGSLEIRLSASGYLQGGVWDEEQYDYGHRIRETNMGSLHDHVINYKIDFDIAGRQNTMTAISLEIEEKEEPWFGDDWGSTVVQQKVVRRKIANEDGGKLEYPRNGQGMYVVTNENETNQWGHARGYAIHPGASAVHLTNLNAKRTERNVDWAKHHLSVTKRKDSEPYSSSQWNINLPGKPTVDFAKFFDSESLEQEDLVVWLNLGTHHLPRAEDSPQTLTNLATSYVLLTPYNFNDFDVSMEVRNSVLLNVPEKAGDKWSIAGHIAPTYCLPRPLPGFKYTGLQSVEEDGSPSPPGTVRQMRSEAEAVHGLYAVREEL